MAWLENSGCLRSDEIRFVRGSCEVVYWRHVALAIEFPLMLTADLPIAERGMQTFRLRIADCGMRIYSLQNAECGWRTFPLRIVNLLIADGGLRNAD
jgi:hypothetical protein